ncbi:MAG: endonuclease/exonuclease/phosphatase family protein [Enterovibrio sp.]
MKLLTLNTHSWQEDEPLAKLEILAKAIIEQDCDVVALQEINQHQNSARLQRDLLPARAPADEPQNLQMREDNYAYLLQQKLHEYGQHYQLTWDFVHQSYLVYEEGLAFLSRLPILQHEVLDLNDGYNEQNWKHRRAVRIRVQHAGQALDLFNCHCGWWNDLESPFQQHIDKIASHVTAHLSFFLGDFNNPAHLPQQGYDHVRQKGWFDCYALAEQKDEGTTVVKKIDGWEENTQRLRLDFVFANQPVGVKRSRTIFTGDFYPVISDHFGVLTEIDLGK